jgi:hypothetical protein
MHYLASGVLSAKSMTFKKGADFKAWLDTVPIEYHHHTRIHRNTCIAMMETRGKQINEPSIKQHQGRRAITKR